MHGAEADFVAAADALPDAVFGRNEVGEALADLCEAHEGCNIGDGGVFEDLDEDFGRDGRYGAWRGEGSVGRGRLSGD